MKYKIYSPKIEAYVLTSGKTEAFLDLSDDIVSGDIARNLDAPSTFSLTLQNKGNKYNGVIHPMDRITLYANKDQRYQLLTGYVSSATIYTLFGEDFQLTGYDTLYQLQNLCWNPNTAQSKLLVGYTVEYDSGQLGTGQQKVIGNLLTKVAGWPVSKVHIGGVPSGWTKWASDMYSVNVGDNSGQENYEKFIALLGKGPKLGGSSSNTDTSATGYTATGNVITDACAWAVAIANDNSHGYNQDEHEGPVDYDCSGLVIVAYRQAGADVGDASYTGNMVQDMTGAGDFTWISPCPDEDGLEKGDILLNITTHTAIYLGNGQMVEAVIDENGNTTGGQEGDQTGREIRVGDLWGIGGYWDGILRYTA